VSKIADRSCVCCAAESRPLDRWGWCPECVADLAASEPSPDELEALAQAAEQAAKAPRKPARASGHPLLPPDGLNAADALWWIMTGKHRQDMPF
jgi:hypothetical protein